MGADGNLYFPGQSTENYRLIALMIFAIVVMASGMWVKRRLIAKYQSRLQSFDHQST
jgi:NADH:ubiquinone oxidoreductase subunit H